MENVRCSSKSIIGRGINIRWKLFICIYYLPLFSHTDPVTFIPRRMGLHHLSDSPSNINKDATLPLRYSPKERNLESKSGRCFLQSKREKGKDHETNYDFCPQPLFLHHPCYSGSTILPDFPTPFQSLRFFTWLTCQTSCYLTCAVLE